MHYPCTMHFTGRGIIKVIIGVLILHIAYAVIMRIELLEPLISILGQGLLALVVTVGILLYVNYYYDRERRFGKIDPQGKAVLITGCDTGFGFETALRLYCMGFHVYAGCLDPKINGGLTLSTVDKNNRLVTLTMDVTSSDQVDNAFQYISNHLDSKNLNLWAVINNAGVCFWSEVEFCSMETYQHVLNVNTLGTIRVTKTFLPLLKKFQGRLVLISSLAGLLSYPGLTAYCMSKHAIAALAAGLRKEFSQWNISVTTVESAGYRTAMVNPQKVKQDMDDNWKTTPKAVREKYGNTYFTSFRDAHIKRLSSLSDNVGQAVDTIVTAVESVHVRDRYFTSLKAEMRAFGRFLPHHWQDVFMLLFESFDSALCRFKFCATSDSHVKKTFLFNLPDEGTNYKCPVIDDLQSPESDDILLQPDLEDSLLNAQTCTGRLSARHLNCV